jgi:hypothetical protein
MPEDYSNIAFFNFFLSSKIAITGNFRRILISSKYVTESTFEF